MLDRNILLPLLLSLFAGLSTVIGAFIVFFSNINQKIIITFSLAFSAGVMISISLVDLFVSSCDILIKSIGNTKGILYSVIFLLIGALITYLINSLIPEENIKYTKGDNKHLFRIGLTSMLALMLHNFPEGMATFVSGYEI